MLLLAFPLCAATLVTVQKDSEGRPTCQAYMNEDGTPGYDKSGYSIIIKEYDEKGRISGEYYYDADGEPFLVKGYHCLWRLYNAKGQVCREEYYDIDGLPVVNTDGRAAVEREYNEDGRVSRDIILTLMTNLCLRSRATRPLPDITTKRAR